MVVIVLAVLLTTLISAAALLAALADAVAATRSSAVVLATSRVDPLRTHREELRQLASRTHVLVCGAGAFPEDVAAVGGDVLAGGPLEAAMEVT